VKKSLQIVILAGGTGTRLWPFSREKTPKQFQPLVGNKTLFQLAVSRALKITKLKNIFVATNKQFVKIVHEQSPRILPKNILAEPAFRDTATCLGFAATVLEKQKPKGVMVVLYADHLIRDEAELARKIRAAAVLARSEKLAIVEIESQFPATQFGWVKCGKELPPVHGEKVLSFKKFTEKPDIIHARRFHSSEKYLWNTGLYVWRTDTLLKKFREHLPQTSRHLAKIARNLNSPKIIAHEYSTCEKISIDYGIMERVATSEVVILPAKLGWSDVGTWESLKDELSKDTENLIENDHITLDSSGNFVKTTQKKFIALVGVKNLVIVDSGDTLLVCEKSQSGEIKKVVQKLVARKTKLL